MRDRVSGSRETGRVPLSWGCAARGPSGCVLVSEGRTLLPRGCVFVGGAGGGLEVRASPRALGAGKERGSSAGMPALGVARLKI